MAQQIATNSAANPNEPQFGIQRIYTKDASFEAPHAPQIFREQWQPQVNMDINTHSQKLEDNVFEVVLHLTVTAKINEKMAFLAEVKQAGIFTIHQFPESQMPQILGSFCPNVIYPYARETITDQVIRGGFPQLYLAPINFDALFEQQMAQAKQQKPAKTEN